MLGSKRWQRKENASQLRNLNPPTPELLLLHTVETPELQGSDEVEFRRGNSRM